MKALALTAIVSETVSMAFPQRGTRGWNINAFRCTVTSSGPPVSLGLLSPLRCEYGWIFLSITSYQSDQAHPCLLESDHAISQIQDLTLALTLTSLMIQVQILSTPPSPLLTHTLAIFMFQDAALLPGH